MKNRGIEKLEAITPSTLVIRVDIAKETHQAFKRFARANDLIIYSRNGTCSALLETTYELSDNLWNKSSDGQPIPY